MPEVAEKIYHDLKKHFKVFYDDGGAVGRDTVTVRERDSMEQTRHKIADLVGLIGERLNIR